MERLEDTILKSLLLDKISPKVLVLIILVLKSFLFKLKCSLSQFL